MHDVRDWTECEGDLSFLSFGVCVSVFRDAVDRGTQCSEQPLLAEDFESKALRRLFVKALDDTSHPLTAPLNSHPPENSLKEMEIFFFGLNSSVATRMTEEFLVV